MCDVSYDEDRCRVRTRPPARAISPASPTLPSPSFASRGASIPSPKPTGTTPVGPRTPYASSSTRQITEPHATANPPRLAPPPRQRARSPAVQSELPVYCYIPLQNDRDILLRAVPNLLGSSGYRTSTTDSSESRAHPCTEQNFTLAHQPAKSLSRTRPRTLRARCHQRVFVPARPPSNPELPVYFTYHSNGPRYPTSSRLEPPIPPATAPPQRIPTNHAPILALNKISPWGCSTLP